MFNETYLAEVVENNKKVVFTIDNRPKAYLQRKFGIDGLYALAGLLIQTSNIEEVIEASLTNGTVILNNQGERIVCSVVETASNRIELSVTHIAEANRPVYGSTRDNVVFLRTA